MRSGLLWTAALLSVVSAKAQYLDDYVKNCVWCKQFGPHKVCVQYTCLTNINGGKECTPGSSYLHRCNICTCGKKPNDEESTCSNNFCRDDVPAYPEG
ncbi:uncharacterized protein LOC126284878 isoform X2 [Schistocerca gregaria]|uniref:uncharacterized protein LOC126284878 isoform X2 n=1 Tax=Schistocerca gregaria TaxID=7010 RepID=UPI00211DEC46|nr:uncharacterized protein LOC126284878 isoform X2 [Schistocerca gregaria]